MTLLMAMLLAVLCYLWIRVVVRLLLNDNYFVKTVGIIGIIILMVAIAIVIT